MGSSYPANPWFMLQVFLLVTSCLCLEITFAVDNLSVNQSLRSSEVLISNRQTFKFGFFSPLSSGYHYVGVMYNVSVLTVIWVANRDRPLNDSTGSVEISENGDLVILDGRKERVWSSNLSASVANCSAKLLDTGNLVLQDNLRGTIVWESFQHASDSHMQGMNISTDLRTNEKNILTSWRSPSDPAPGSFTASIEPLEVPQFVVWNGSDPYWRSGPWNGQVFIGIPDMGRSPTQNGFHLVNDNPATANLTYAFPNVPIPLYLVLNFSGILQQKLWSYEKNAWEVTWSSIENLCDVYGRCGPFGSCNPQAMPICTCLPGFEPKSIDEWNAGNWTSGCTRKTPLLCEKNESGKQDEFFMLKKVKLPDHVKTFPAVKKDCSRPCSRNCSCIAYAFVIGIGCMFWTESLIDVQNFFSGGEDLYIRLANSEADNRKDSKALIATMGVLGFIIIFVCAYFLLKMYRGHRQNRQLFLERSTERDPENSNQSSSNYVDGFKLEELPFFALETLLNATSKFDSVYKLGQGGFGPVYKGKLPNGQEIAVKRLARSSNQGLDEFKNEVEVISKLQHRNLVRLLGCCVEHEEKMLVYEYMPNGSLDAYLFDAHKRELLNWRKRMVIIEGISRGLLYLHRDSRLRIIHRDLKASNILLDEELNPKISDFGMARIFEGNDHQANTTRIVGTFGYIAPEYALEGRFSEKSDVYSFGILLLEIVSGRRNTGFYNDQQAQSLVAWAWKLWKEENIINLVDPLINDPQMEAEKERYVHIGLLCVQEIAEDRPSISTVLSMLSSEILELPHPRRPAFIMHRITSQTESSGRRPGKWSANDVTVSIVEGR